jgi:hypothetical protein
MLLSFPFPGYKPYFCESFFIYQALLLLLNFRCIALLYFSNSTELLQHRGTKQRSNTERLRVTLFTPYLRVEKI